MQFSSQLIEDAVDAFASLPGVGRKTALRLVLHLLQQPKEETDKFTQSITRFRHGIKSCKYCHNLSDNDICNICTDHKRDQQTICVVENIRDLMAIEDTHQYRGLYHVLGGVISPIEGIGVFAIVPIKKGTKVFEFNTTPSKDTIDLTPSDVEELPKHVLRQNV